MAFSLFLMFVKIYDTFYKLTFNFFHKKPNMWNYFQNRNVTFEKKPQEAEHCILQILKIGKYIY